MIKELEFTTQMPLVSVIIPSFNVAECIERTIRSVLIQTHSNVEVICVDDFSTDDTLARARIVASTDSRVRCYHNEVKGANNARSRGVQLAIGSYIVFLDSDDELSPWCIEHLIELAQKFSADMVCANIVYVDQGCEETRFSYHRVSEAVKLSEAPESILDIRPSACGKIFRKEVLKQLDFVDVPFAQDWNISYKAALNSSLVVFSNRGVYRYHIRSDSTSTRRRDVTLQELNNVCDCITDIVVFCDVLNAGQFRYEVNVLSSRFMLNMLTRSFYLGRTDRRLAHKKFLAVYSRIIGRRWRMSQILAERGRMALVHILLSSWFLSEAFRRITFRGV